jgi:E3 ubiquitin-protein ligase RNF1/2
VKKRSAAKAIDSAPSRKSRGYMQSRRRGQTSSDIVLTDFDEEDREENGNDGSKESSSVDDRHSPEVRQKRARRWTVPQCSPVKTTTSIENSTEENENSGSARDILATSPLRGEMLAWGKNGTRSQSRHGNSGGSSGRTAKAGRVARLVDQLRIADEFNIKVKRKCTTYTGI